MVDFPKPLQTVVLELEPGHQLLCFVTHGPQTIGPIAVPPGAQPRLQLPVATTRIELIGLATLFALRVPGALNAQPVAVSVLLPPVKLENTPRPQPPVWAWIDNLQKAIPPPTTDDAPKEVAPRHALGFEIRWRPPISGGLTEWPADLQGRPPLDAAIFQIEHSRRPAPGQPHVHPDWAPLLPDENWFMGSRDHTLPRGRLVPNGDVMERYPESPPPQGQAQLDFLWRHAFEADERAHGHAPPTPVPEPGSYHQYPRAVDRRDRPPEQLLVRQQRRALGEAHSPAGSRRPGRCSGCEPRGRERARTGGRAGEGSDQGRARPHGRRRTEDGRAAGGE